MSGDPEMNPAAPAISVVLSTAGRFADIRVTVRHLQRQTIARQMEVIILAPDTTNFGMEAPDTSGFSIVQLIALGKVSAVADANALGVQRASAPVVVFSEDHAFPHPTWAEALVSRHREAWAGVGPVVRNGNPAGAVSWADYMLGYGPWHEGQPGGSAGMLPGHNSSYKRAALLQFGTELPALLIAETVLQLRLIAKGDRLYLENRARISHLNFGRLGVFLAVQYHNGRQFASCRIREWSVGRRVVYALGSPLIPLVRLRRTLGFAVPLPQRPGRSRIMLALLAGLVADGLGQFAGYVAGAGKSPEFLTGYEYNRIRFITPEERAGIERA